MFLLDWLGIAFRLAAAVALVAVCEAGPNLVPGSAGQNHPAERALLDSPALTATPRLQSFPQTPLCFEANRGQTDAQVQYLARGPGYTVFLTATEAVLALRPMGQSADLAGTGEAGQWPTPQPQPAVLRMQLIDSNPAAQARGPTDCRASSITSGATIRRNGGPTSRPIPEYSSRTSTPRSAWSTTATRSSWSTTSW